MSTLPNGSHQRSGYLPIELVVVSGRDGNGIAQCTQDHTAKREIPLVQHHLSPHLKTADAAGRRKIAAHILAAIENILILPHIVDRTIAVLDEQTAVTHAVQLSTHLGSQFVVLLWPCRNQRAEAGEFGLCLA